MDVTRRAHIFGNNPWIELHAALALFSYGVFGLLALTAAMLLLRNYSLKHKQLGGWFSFLPSIIDLDLISVRLLGTGTILLTAALAVGSVYWLQDLGRIGLPHLLTFAVWAAYATTLGLRLRGRLVSRSFAWTCMVLFAVALLSLGPVSSGKRHQVQVEQS